MQKKSERIRIVRADNGLSQAAFAKEIGISQTTLARYESGQVKIDSTAIATIVDRFGENPLWLLGLTDDRTQPPPSGGDDADVSPAVPAANDPPPGETPAALTRVYSSNSGNIRITAAEILRNYNEILLHSAATFPPDPDRAIGWLSGISLELIRALDPSLTTLPEAEQAVTKAKALTQKLFDHSRKNQYKEQRSPEK